ncbi:MAG: 30S ribosome-binding factor RbfA [Elusimicrobia bacterium]|nr:30S ribosome-binding factor RbfA [Elusimicrobiota bacterium]
MPSRRIVRVNELLLQEISRVVLERQDPEVGFVTFTGVQVTDDLMQAKVFYSVLGSEADQARTAAALERMRSEIRRSMRRLESLKRIPELEFIFDTTPERAARVFEILDRIHHESPSPEVPRENPVEPPREPKTVRGRKRDASRRPPE